MKVNEVVAVALFALSALLFVLAACLPRARPELQCVAAAAFSASFAALAWP